MWLSAADLLLAVEIISPGSEAIDQVVKVAEYAAAGIPRYWTVARDAAHTVTMYRLGADGYARAAQLPLAWLLQSRPGDHLSD